MIRLSGKALLTLLFTLDDDTFDVKEIIEIVDPDLDADEIEDFVKFDHAFFKLERTNLDTSYNSKVSPKDQVLNMPTN